MIVFLLILAIIVLYYYCNHKFLETFEDTSVNLDDIVNDPDKTSNFIDKKIGKKSKTTYAKWCDLFGFKYHCIQSTKETFPKEWLKEIQSIQNGN